MQIMLCIHYVNSLWPDDSYLCLTTQRHFMIQQWELLFQLLLPSSLSSLSSSLPTSRHCTGPSWCWWMPSSTGYWPGSSIMSSTVGVLWVHAQKRKGRQDDCPDRHRGRWRQASTSSVMTKAVTLTTTPFLWRWYYGMASEFLRLLRWHGDI